MARRVVLLTGVLSALFPRLGHLLMRMVDVLMAFPTLLLALGLIVILSPSVATVILVIVVVYLLINLIVDLSYRLLDPRVELQ